MVIGGFQEYFLLIGWLTRRSDWLIQKSYALGRSFLLGVEELVYLVSKSEGFKGRKF